MRRLLSQISFSSLQKSLINFSVLQLNYKPFRSLLEVLITTNCFFTFIFDIERWLEMPLPIEPCCISSISDIFTNLNFLSSSRSFHLSSLASSLMYTLFS